MTDDPDRLLWRRRSFLGWTAALGAALLTRPALAALPRDKMCVFFRAEDGYMVQYSKTISWPALSPWSKIATTRLTRDQLDRERLQLIAEGGWEREPTDIRREDW